MNANITDMENNDRISTNDSMIEMRKISTNSDISSADDGDMVLETESANPVIKWISFFDRPFSRNIMRRSNYIRSYFDFSPDYTDSLTIRRPAYEAAEHQQEIYKWKKKRCLGLIILVIAIVIMIVVGTVIPNVLQLRQQTPVTSKTEQSIYNSITVITGEKSKKFIVSEEPYIRSSISVEATSDLYETEADIYSYGGNNVSVMSTLALPESEDTRIFSCSFPSLKLTSSLTILKTPITDFDGTANSVILSLISDNDTLSFTTTSNIEGSFSDILYYTVSPEAATGSNIIHTGPNSITPTVTSSIIGDLSTEESHYTLASSALTASIKIMQRTSLIPTDSVLNLDITPSSIIFYPSSEISPYTSTLRSEELALASSLDPVLHSAFYFDRVSSSMPSSSKVPSAEGSLLRYFETVSSFSYREDTGNTP